MMTMRFLLPLLLAAWPCLADDAGGASAAVTQVPLVFAGGHDTDPRDHGRPVMLVAAALKVPSDVFREAFTHVQPAPPGQNGPTPDEARANKRALMDALAPYGVTNDRLDEVSNRYRYRRDRGEMWPTAEATGYATVSNGMVTGFVVTSPGYGYSSPPTVSVKGMPDTQAVATLSFDTDFAKNGSVQSIALPTPAK
jgi:hypothetical protein